MCSVSAAVTPSFGGRDIGRANAHDGRDPFTSPLRYGDQAATGHTHILIGQPLSTSSPSRRPTTDLFVPHCCGAGARPKSVARSGAGVGEEDLGDAGRLLEGSEVSCVGEEGDRPGGSNRGEVGFALWGVRPVVFAVDQGHWCGNTGVEFSGGDHARHVAEDLARHARVAATTSNAT
jgi:hypothetical protein